MKINNYLLDLDSKIYSKKGSDNIRIYGVGELIKEVYNELKNFKSIPKIESEFKAHQVFSCWVLNKVGIAIQDLYALFSYWKNICEKSDKEFQDLWNKCYNSVKFFGCMNGKKIKLPKKLDYKLAYLLGVIFGDGHLAEPNKSYDKLTTYNSELRITDQYRETFIFLTNLFKDLFGYTPKIYSERSKVNKLFYRFVIKSKPLHRFIMVVCGMPVGNKSGKLKVPEIIKNAPLEFQKWFVAGFFDADGCVPIINKRPVIQITQYDSLILEDIKKISFSLGLKWVGPYCYKYRYNNCNIRINRRKDIQKFLNTIPSLNQDKLRQRELAWQTLKKMENLQNI